MRHRSNYTVSRKPIHGFTLIELLVVISIITMLMAILMPALSSARAQVKRVVCASNVKQLALGLIMYEQENETFPQCYELDRTNEPPGGWIGTSNAWYWFHYAASALGPNLGKTPRSLYTCPARKMKIPDYEVQGSDYIVGNYAINQGIARAICKGLGSTNPSPEFIGKPLGLKHMKRPQETLLLLDHGGTHAIWRQTNPRECFASYNNLPTHYYIPGIVNPKDVLWARVLAVLNLGVHADATKGRHPGRTVNVGFVDGHVQSMPVLDLVVSDNSMLADQKPYPLWRPGKTVVQTEHQY